MQVHIRQFDLHEKSGKLYPTRVGTCFSPKRFANFTNMIHLIDEQVKLLREGEPVSFKNHLGGGVYCTVNTGFDCVNIRQYFMPPNIQEEIPTRSGIAIRLSEWDEIVKCIEDVKNLSPELKNAEICYLQQDHQYLMQFVECPECNSFPLKE